MKKLKDLLKESAEMGRVYSNPFATAFVKETEETNTGKMEMTEEQKQAFYEAVKQYKRYGESVYRNEGLSEVYESIKNMVEVARKVTLSETGDWFDNVTVGRHMKRMGESFRVFEKTLKEVSTLQQRLEASYDEIGEVLGKYYEISELNEIEEGNEFGSARAKAIANGDSEFEVDGKTYKVTNVDKEDKENAEKFASESLKEFNYPQSKMSNVFNLHFAQLTDKLPGMFYIVGRDVYHNDKKIVSLTGMDSVKSAVAKVKKKLGIKESMKLTDMIKKPSVNEDIGVIDERPFGKKGIIIMIDDNGKTVSAIFKDKKNADLYNRNKTYDVKRLLDLAKKVKYPNAIDESVNENASAVIEKNIWTAIQMSKYADGDDYLQKMLFGRVRDSLIGNKHIVTKISNIKTKLGKGSSDITITAKVDVVLPGSGQKGTKTYKYTQSNSKFKAIIESLNEAKYDIGMARKGNGLTIYNRAEDEAGDYKNIAHIDNKGNIKLYDKKLPTNIKKMIEKEAEKLKESVNEGNKMIKLKDLLKESIGIGELPSSKLMKMKVPAKDMLKSVNEAKYIDKLSGKELAKRMLKNKIFKPFAKQFAKMKIVTHDDLQNTLPDWVPGKEIQMLFSESVNEARGLNEHTYNEFIRDNFPKINVKKEEIGIKSALKALGVKSGDEIGELTNTMDSTNTALYLTNAKENGELKELPIKSAYFEKAYLGKWKNGKPIVVFSDGWDEFVYLKEGVLKAESSLPTNKSVNEARLKKVTKQMWAKMNDEQRVNALLTFFKDPNDAEEYFDSEWNDLPSGADGGMYIFE